MVKLWPLALHSLEPATPHVPVIEPPERFKPLLVAVLVPVTVPFRVRVLPPDATV